VLERHQHAQEILLVDRLVEMIAAEMDVVAATAELPVQVPQVEQVVRPSQDVRRIGRIRERPEPLQPLFHPAARQRVGVIQPECQRPPPDQGTLEHAPQISHARKPRGRFQQRISDEVVGGDLALDEWLVQRCQRSPIVVRLVEATVFGLDDADAGNGIRAGFRRRSSASRSRMRAVSVCSSVVLPTPVGPTSKTRSVGPGSARLCPRPMPEPRVRPGPSARDPTV